MWWSIFGPPQTAAYAAFCGLLLLRRLYIPGAVAQALPHEDPYIVEFTPLEFMLNGVRNRTRQALVRAGIIRWVMNCRFFAYSYGLIPVSAHRVNDHWRIDSEAGCIYSITFVDDRGDGVFRILAPGPLTEQLVPAWVRQPNIE